MRVMRARVLGLLAVAACSGPSRPRPPDVVAQLDAGVEAVVVTATPDATRCADAAADAERRQPGAERIDHELDPDGDGVDGPVFVSCGGGRNCDYLLYGCAGYLGTVIGGRFNEPWCIEPATAGVPCKVSVGMQMIHGDTQQSFYEYVGGTYVQTGAGKLTGRARD